MRAPGGLGRLLTGDFWASAGYTAGLWRPLPLLMFWIEGRLGGWEPWLFHAMSVLLHAASAAAVGLLLVQAGIPVAAAAIGAAAFATMPAHLEVAAWISGRTDLLCGLCALLALWLDRRARAAGRTWPGAPALAAFAAALLSKESAAGWVGVIAVAEWVRGRGRPGDGPGMARWLAPYAAITAAWLVAHAAAAGPAALPGYVDEAMRARRHAAGWTMVPQFLAFLWPWSAHASDVALALPARPLDVRTIAGASLTIGVAAIALILVVRRSRLAVPAAIVLVPLVPLVGVALARGYLSSGERMVFLASAGVAWIVAEAVARAGALGPMAHRVATGLALVLVLGGALETLRLQPTWANDERVFRTMTERQPGNPVGWVGLGETLTRAGQAEDAGRALARAEQLAPSLPAVHAARAALHYRFGEWDRVLPAASRALALDPGLHQTRLMRASTLIRLGRPGEAAPDIEQLLAERPLDPSVLIVAGQRHLAEGHPAEAIAPFTTALTQDPGDSGLWAALGQAQAAVGNLAAARSALERSLAVEPRSPAAWRRLAAVCAAMGDTVAARAALERGQAAGAAPGP
jgi:cytochrome c-type biogenesis protein CcmH/NrfG